MDFHQELNRLHAAIFDDPDDVELRRDLARHLEPVAPARAEFVRLQVERHVAAIRTRWFRSQPNSRERELLADHGADWAQLVTPLARLDPHEPRSLGYSFHRGLVEWLRTDAGVFVAMGESLLRLGPVLHLDLVPDGTDLQEVLAEPALSRVASLSLAGWDIDDAGAQRIAHCDHLERMDWLNLHANRIGTVGAEALAASASTRRITLISLRDNPKAGTAPAIDRAEYDEHGRIQFIPTRLGLELEARYGDIPWLHPERTHGADRFHLRDALRTMNEARTS